MTQRVGTIATLVLFAMGCDGDPVPPDGSTPDAAVVRDGGSRDGGGVVSIDGGGPARWARRSCGVTIRHAPPVGATRVRIAGEFTAWADGALDLRDDDRDGTFEITLLPNPRLSSGELYAYKLVIGADTWILDPAARYRKYASDCLNSAFRMPACGAGPEITVVRPLTSTPDGRASVRVAIATASDGAAIDEFAVTLDGGPVDASAVRLDRAAGAFDVELTNVPDGKHTLSFRATDDAARSAEPVDLPFWIEESPFEWRDSTMYMVVVDRFANGDRANDDPVGAPVPYPADFHGGDLQGALEVLRSGYFEGLGVNVIWLSPINRQADGEFGGRDDGQRYAGYHGYWPSRAREVEPRFGGNEALRVFVEEAHRRGIRVLLDLINNQIHDQHEYFAAHPEWFRTGCVCGIDAGCGWSERPLDCLFAPYLPDIDWRVPEAEAQFVADAVHWVEEYGVDGFRIDAVKHVETNAVTNLRAALARRFEQGGARLLLVGETAVGEWDRADYGCGETYANGYQWIDAYVGESGLDGQFDFPTHHRLQDGLVTDRMGFDQVEAVVRDVETRYDASGLHVRFLGTHDSNRMASRASFDAAQGCRWPGDGACASMPTTPTDGAAFARLRRALTVLYTLPGIPFLYYGDEIAMAGGNDPDNRRDMLWTDGLAGVAMGGTTVASVQEQLRSYVRALGTARAGSIALRRGRRVPLASEPDVYVYAYVSDAPRALAVVAVNRGGAIERRAVDGLSARSTEGFGGFAAEAGEGALGLEGARLRLTLPAGGSAVFVAR